MMGEPADWGDNLGDLRAGDHGTVPCIPLDRAEFVRAALAIDGATSLVIEHLGESCCSPSLQPLPDVKMSRRVVPARGMRQSAFSLDDTTRAPLAQDLLTSPYGQILHWYVWTPDALAIECTDWHKQPGCRAVAHTLLLGWAQRLAEGEVVSMYSSPKVSPALLGVIIVAVLAIAWAVSTFAFR